jgi:hypothetical protein
VILLQPESDSTVRFGSECTATRKELMFWSGLSITRGPSHCNTVKRSGFNTF